AALPELPGIGPHFVRSFAHGVLRFELGRLLLELGRAREAEPYFRSLEFISGFVGPQVEFYLGQVYEALDDPEEAKLHYARFVRRWEDCDPELRPLWERGRQALARLTGEPVGN
ncbi:MAG: tetratricopeptide repeat protein, partial [Gemmatimonadota bacterium]